MNRTAAALVAGGIAVAAAVGSVVAYANSMPITSQHLDATATSVSLTTTTTAIPNSTCTLNATSIDPSFADTVIDEKNSTATHGTDATMAIESKSGFQLRSLLRFNLATAKCAETGAVLPSGKTIVSGNLTLAITAVDGLQSTAALAPAGHSWAESTTWAGADATLTGTPPAATASITLPASAPTTGTWAVTSDVQGFYGGTLTNNGWMIVDTTAETANAHQGDFGTRDNATSTNRPKLVIQYH